MTTPTTTSAMTDPDDACAAAIRQLHDASAHVEELSVTLYNNDIHVEGCVSDRPKHMFKTNVLEEHDSGYDQIVAAIGQMLERDLPRLSKFSIDN